MKKLMVTLALLTALNPHARALETDQFTLPPAPLRDAGPAVADAFYRTLEKIALSNPPDAMTAAKLFYSAWAKGVPYCQAERWLNDGPEFAQGGRFAVDIAESIYVRAQPRLIFNKIAPTVNMYGVYFGTDKIGHLFQQGFEYFKVYSLGRRIGLSEAQAQKRAVSIGVLQERTYFGTITDGVYSNGDLAADFAGLKFYRRFFNEVKIGKISYSPIFIRSGHTVKMNPSVKPEDILAPFISFHLSEVINTSIYFYSPREITSEIRKRCEIWRARHLIETVGLFENQVATYYGEDYGYGRGRGQTVKFSAICSAP